MSRNVTLEIGGFYHIYNRGTEKRKVFLDKKDYHRFLALLYLANTSKSIHITKDFKNFDLKLILATPQEDPLTSIVAYCLMPNHFHLLLKEKTENGISKFIQKLSTAYTMYFNKRYERTGALFQGKFKAQSAQDDQYLKYLISYIHLNPIKIMEPRWKELGIQNFSRAEHFLFEYEYSSYRDFANKTRILGLIINKEELPDYFETKQDFIKIHREWLKYKTKSLKQQG